jgi:hypothetical protein
VRVLEGGAGDYSGADSEHRVKISLAGWRAGSGAHTAAASRRCPLWSTGLPAGPQRAVYRTRPRLAGSPIVFRWKTAGGRSAGRPGFVAFADSPRTPRASPPTRPHTLIRTPSHLFPAPTYCRNSPVPHLRYGLLVPRRMSFSKREKKTILTMSISSDIGFGIGRRGHGERRHVLDSGGIDWRESSSMGRDPGLRRAAWNATLRPGWGAEEW